MDPIVVILPTVLVAIALAAPRYGADSRLPTSGERQPPPRRPPTVARDLVVLTRRMRQACAGVLHSH